MAHVELSTSGHLAIGSHKVPSQHETCRRLQFRGLSTSGRTLTQGPTRSGWRRSMCVVASKEEDSCHHKPLAPADSFQGPGNREDHDGVFQGLGSAQPSNIEDGRIIREYFKGWVEEDGIPNHAVVARLRTLAVAAGDRSRMHGILAIQRDNWNRLYNVTLSMATITAAALSALQGCLPSSPSLPLTAFLLDAGAASIMAVLNRFQPSQLAEEQRAAEKFFQSLCQEIEATLQIDPRMREDADLFLEDKVGQMHAMDQAFPLPLTPLVLPRFPTTMQPTKLSSRAADLEQLPLVPISNPSNGWTAAIAEDLEQVACRLGAADGDVELYRRLMERLMQVNRGLAVASPVLAAMAAMVSGAALVTGPSQGTACLAAVLNVAAVLAHSVTNCLQLGMLFELHRNCSGYHDHLRSSIQRSQRLPVEKREDGELFHYKVALQLGRTDGMPLIHRGDILASKLSETYSTLVRVL